MGGVINFRRFLLLAFTVLFVCERVCVLLCSGLFKEHATDDREFW